jgi:hypothetical protein
VTFGPICTLFTAAAVHAADVFGSLSSVRHNHPHDELSNVAVLATVTAPLFSCTAAPRVPASLFCKNPRVVTATTDTGVTAIGAMV